jgi:ABC-type multidrug transport system fused ATPase/permease subunit
MDSKEVLTLPGKKVLDISTLARAFLKKAPILLMDEALSNLDTKNEQEVQSALSALKEGRTTIIIAHRLSTIMTADRLVVLRDGEVV